MAIGHHVRRVKTEQRERMLDDFGVFCIAQAQSIRARLRTGPYEPEPDLAYGEGRAPVLHPDLYDLTVRA